MSDILKADTRITDPDIQTWLSAKKNKSEVTRKALKLLYEKELQADYIKQEIKPKVSLIA